MQQQPVTANRFQNVISETTFLLATDELFRGAYGGNESNSDDDVEQVIAEVTAFRAAQHAQQQAERVAEPPAAVLQPAVTMPQPDAAPVDTSQSILLQQVAAPQPIAPRKREVDHECLPGRDVFEFRQGDWDDDHELGSDDITQENPA